MPNSVICHAAKEFKRNLLACVRLGVAIVLNPSYSVNTKPYHKREKYRKNK